MELVFKLYHQSIQREDLNVVATKSRNYLEAKFELLSDDWVAPITALFNDYAVVLDENRKCLVPWEVLENPGKVTVSAFCGDLHTTTCAYVSVRPSGYMEGQTPGPPTPSVYLQLTGMVQTAVNTANDVKQRADSGAFNGKDGAPGANGLDAPQIDDTEASSDHPWSGAKVSQEVGELSSRMDSLSKEIDIILGKDAPTTFEEIRFAVEQGRASRYFSVGDQLKPNWTDGISVYENPFDIVQLEGNPELETGETIHGMVLQQHYANVNSCPFDAREALYDADEELPAGTYHFTVAGNTWLSSENGKVIQFTLTQPIPAGGQLVYSNLNGYNQPIAGQKISTYSGPDSFDAIETVVLSEGSGGIDLGTTDGRGDLNHHQRAFMGSGRWKTSMLRQYLNSDKPAGQWWTKQDRWDRASAFIHMVPGYMSGFDADFLSVIKPVKVQTSRDTVLSDGGTDITYDYFFPISLEQMNAAPQAAGVEGSALDYWKAIASEDSTGNLDTSGRFKQFGIYPDLVALLLNAKTSKVSCFLRSARRTMTYNPWVVYEDGGVTTYSAVSDFSCVPACVIC